MADQQRTVFERIMRNYRQGGKAGLRLSKLDVVALAKLAEVQARGVSGERPGGGCYHQWQYQIGPGPHRNKWVCLKCGELEPR